MGGGDRGGHVLKCVMISLVFLLASFAYGLLSLKLITIFFIYPAYLSSLACNALDSLSLSSSMLATLIFSFSSRSTLPM